MLTVLPNVQEPEWLKDISQETISKYKINIVKILENSLYYPSCGSDGLPISSFAGSIRSFIYVDYGFTRDELYSKFKYKIIASRKLTKSDLTPNGWEPNWQSVDGDPARYLNSRIQPFCEWIIFEINGVKCSLLFLCADGVATYQALYKKNKIAPRIIALIQSGVIHGNWTNYSDPNTILHKTVFSAESIAPEYLLHGGYYQLLGDRLYFRQPCWPEYTEKIISAPHGIYDLVFHKGFKGKVVLWKHTNILKTEMVNRTSNSLYAPSEASVPKIKSWEGLHSQIMRNEVSGIKIPNPLMFQYGSNLNYINKLFIFKWHLSHAGILDIRPKVENYLKNLRPIDWET